MNCLCNDVSSIVLGISIRLLEVDISGSRDHLLLNISREGQWGEGEGEINYNFMQAKWFNLSYNSG